MMNYVDARYDQLIEQIIHRGELIEGRNGGMVQLFGTSLSVSHCEGFPMITGRKLYPRGVFGELAAFLRGATTLEEFRNLGCNYWDQWADNAGNLGPLYGSQWRNWGAQSIDQIRDLVQSLLDVPHSRRHIVTCWNPGENELMALPPCYPTFQVSVGLDGNLDLVVNQRSADVMVGLPSDMILFGTLMQLLCNDTNLKPRNLTFHFGSAHIYWAHRSNALVYLDRRKSGIPLPKVNTQYMGVNDFNPDRVKIEGYCPLAPLAFEVFE